MTEAEIGTAVEKLPTTVQPFAHLANFMLEKIHQIGTLGSAIAVVAGGAFYAWPLLVEQVALQKATQANILLLQQQAEKAMPLLEEATQAVPLLRQISKQQSEVVQRP